MATKRMLCPLSQLLTPNTIAGLDAPAAGYKLNAAPCMGPKCQLWGAEPNADPETGNCALFITAAATAAIAQRAEEAFEAARRIEVEAEKAKADVELARVRFAELMAATEKVTSQLVQLVKKN